VRFCPPTSAPAKRSLCLSAARGSWGECALRRLRTWRCREVASSLGVYHRFNRGPQPTLCGFVGFGTVHAAAVLAGEFASAPSKVAIPHAAKANCEEGERCFSLICKSEHDRLIQAGAAYGIGDRYDRSNRLINGLWPHREQSPITSVRATV